MCSRNRQARRVWRMGCSASVGDNHVMFTGLVEALGSVRKCRDDGAGRLLRVADATVAQDLPQGASVAVNGVCLTVIERGATQFSFHLDTSMLGFSSLGELCIGYQVTLDQWHRYAH